MDGNGLALDSSSIFEAAASSALSGSSFERRGSCMHVGGRLTGGNYFIEGRRGLFCSKSGRHFFTFLLNFFQADVDHRSKHGCTPLHLAALKGNKKCAESLVKYGADMEARTSVSIYSNLGFINETMMRLSLSHCEKVNFWVPTAN